MDNCCSAPDQIKRILEALLFASSAPIPFRKLQEITASSSTLTTRELQHILRELQSDYAKHAFELVEVAEGYVLRTRSQYAPYIAQLFGGKQPERLSNAATEVLALIAFRGPVTRAQIEAIRGVDSSGVMQGLMERQLIEPAGRLEAPGKPTLYAVTKTFLSHFGVQQLEDLTKPICNN